MKQSSIHTVIGLFFLFLGSIELIACGIIVGMDVYTAITDWLIFFVVVHVVMGYGFLASPILLMVKHFLLMVKHSAFWEDHPGQIKCKQSESEVTNNENQKATSQNEREQS